MHKASRGRLAASLVLCLGACGSGQPLQSGGLESDAHPVSATQPTTRPATQPATQPTQTLSTSTSSEALKAARLSYQAMGGAEGFAKTAKIDFAFRVQRDKETVLERHHTWDLLSSRDKVVGYDREGREYVVEVDLKHLSGQVFHDGQRLEGEQARPWLERAHAQWINDSYWLLMPSKLLDPGVTLEDQGLVERDDRSYRKLKLSFDQVGLTPGDTYWAFIDPDTGLMHRWEYVLQGQEPPPREWLWEDWAQYGPLRLSALRRSTDGSTVIDFPGLSVSSVESAAE